MDDDAVFILTKDGVIACAKGLEIRENAITDHVLEQVKKGADWGLGCWAHAVKEAINLALKS